MPPDSAATERPLRVLRALTRPNLGGPTRQAIALWHAHKAQGVETLLVTGEVGPEEVWVDLAAPGLPAVDGAAWRPGFLTLSSLRRGLSPLRDLRAGRELRALIRTVRPDVVHTPTSKAGALARRAAIAEGTKVVAHTFHGHVLQDYFGPLRSGLLARIERRLASRTDLLFAVSDSCADELAELGVAARERLRVLPPAVEVGPAFERAEARRMLGIPDGAWAVVSVGRLVPVKRLQDLVAVCAEAPELHADVLGDGPLLAQLRAQAAATCGDRLRLCGAEPDAARLLAAYDAVVLPSVREGLPLVAVEAFAAGVPVVGYDVPGVRDALQTVGRGVLVPVADGPAGLLAGLQRLRCDASFAADLCDHARRAVARCRPEAVAERLRSADREALHTRGEKPARLEARSAPRLPSAEQR